MPYIPESERERAAMYPETVGELNYNLSRTINDWLLAKGVRYETLNEVAGVLKLCASEFERCVVGPYEQEKREINGDVWTCLDEKPIPITDEWLAQNTIHCEETRQTWYRCFDENECGLHLIGPGKVACEHCDQEEDYDLSELGIAPV